MVELRWFSPYTAAQPILQYRYMQPCMDASGALCPGEWSEWRDVPFVRDQPKDVEARG